MLLQSFEAFFTESAREKYSGYVSAVENACGECYTVTPDVAGKLSGTKTAQGVFCICEMPADNGKIDYSGRYTALENLQLAHRWCNRQKSDKLAISLREEKDRESGIGSIESQAAADNGALPLHFDWMNYKGKTY